VSSEHFEKTSYEELKRRLEAAESALQAIREGRVDTILGESETLVVRMAEAEAREEHLKQVLLTIRNVNQLIVAEDDPQRLIERACVNLTETMGYHNAWIALLGGEPARELGLPVAGPVAAASAAGFDGGFEILRERIERGEFPDCMAQALASEDVVVFGDPVTDCPDCPLQGHYRGRAGLVRRLEFDGVTWGILTASVPAAYARDAEEQDLFNEVAGDLAFALYKITTTRKLEENRRYLGLVIEGSGVGTWEWNVQTNETIFNEQWAAMLGYTIEDLTPYDYATWERLVHPA
jgi:PAS domain-containing protein